MTAARIDRVAYIGWRGMEGCEVIDFDGELTGFIGAGGAGKSTLIMALDYALLPDRRSMNIRSVSDLEDAHTSGIDPLLGRIDADYGYAYVVLDITTRRNERLIAGIFVEPEDGSAKLKGWFINNPPSRETRVDALMRCHDGDEIYYPDLTTLEREWAANGIDATSCKVIGDYGQMLYEAGILPGPMNSAADRMLFGNLLGTTFRGGISKEVATHLKDYLLPAQTHVQDLVQGLQQCTNEVLRTRHAVADADRQLALLESTYGTGKEAVLTALRCIAEGLAASELALRTLKTDFDNKSVTSQSLGESIPTMEKEIAAAEATKKTKIATAELKRQELEQTKDRLLQQKIDCKAAMDAAQQKLRQFNGGGWLWKDIVPQQIQGGGFHQARTWFDSAVQKAQRDVFTVENAIKALQEEDDRLSNERASAAAEHLADILGGQSLEQALGHVSEKDAIALELALCGLANGVVGVDVSALADLEPSPDLPDIFWLGEAPPAARPPKETGNWYVAATSSGYIVANKAKTPTFGREARQQRRHVIASELKKKGTDLIAKNKVLQEADGKKSLLLERKDDIEFYLKHRENVFAIDKEAKGTQKAYDECTAEHKNTLALYAATQKEIETIQEPADREIAELRQQFRSAEKRYAFLQSEITELRKSMEAESARLVLCEAEQDAARTILGTEFDRFRAASMDLPTPAKNVSGQQTQRITQLGRILGEDVERLSSFREVAVDQPVSVIRLWPDLITIVMECVNVELADSDGGDLIQAMREQRGRLDVDLKTWESELGIKAKNIYMTISGSVKSQTQKIARLSKLGQTIEFGNVTGIQIRLVLRSRMMDVLQQFAELFADQRSLFAKDKPVDQLLKEFFDANMSNGVKLTGEQLLDYRNYVDLVIEVRRKGNEKWELAASLSGTEVIGGGLAIALMLVRSIAARAELAGSGIKVQEIRPLFAVDEVGRLNSEGQRLLVDFAKRENFQLVVTAPNIKPTYNCTLYALTRQFEPDRLIVRGIKHRSGPTPHAV